MEPHLPRGRPGKPQMDNWQVISGILHMLKTSCCWRDLPATFGPPTTTYNCFNRWSQRSLWQRLFARMAGAGDVLEELILDSSHVKAHRSAASRKREWTQAIGCSRVGRSSKIHCLADDRGRPVAFAPTSGNVTRISMALPLLGAVTTPKRLTADKAYDAESLRCWL